MAKYRLQAPIDQETEHAIRMYAEATGTTLAKAAADILKTTAPVLLELANAIGEAKTAPAKAMRSVLHTLDQAVSDADQLKMELKPQQARRKKGKG